MGYVPAPAPTIQLTSADPYSGPGYYMEDRIRDWEQGRNIPHVSDLFDDDGREPLVCSKAQVECQPDIARYPRFQLEGSVFKDFLTKRTTNSTGPI